MTKQTWQPYLISRTHVEALYRVLIVYYSAFLSKQNFILCDLLRHRGKRRT